MANFQTHITFSSLVGVGYGAAGHVYGNMPPTTSVLAGGLCGLAGMLPDVDSDSSVPLRETLAIASALVPMLMMDHFVRWGLTHEAMVLAAACIYIIIRFGLGEMLRRYTVHRGMWHSLPAAAIAGLLVLALTSEEDAARRLFKAGAVMAGYLSHLFLDQLYGLRTGRGAIGSPLKLWRNDAWANTSTYLKLGVLAAWAAADPQLMDYVGLQDTAVHALARDLFDYLRTRYGGGTVVG
jgi:membrane-bound metal-dependent hydrolase YbcI (DUF457 family)